MSKFTECLTNKVVLSRADIHLQSNQLHYAKEKKNLYIYQTFLDSLIQN